MYIYFLTEAFSIHFTAGKNIHIQIHNLNNVKFVQYKFKFKTSNKI